MPVAALQHPWIARLYFPEQSSTFTHKAHDSERGRHERLRVQRNDRLSNKHQGLVVCGGVVRLKFCSQWAGVHSGEIEKLDCME